MLETRMEIRVGWGDCDPARIVYNPVFFDWMERGMLFLFIAAGLAAETAQQQDPLFRGVPLVKSTATFASPARNGDTLLLASRVSRWGNTSFDVAHRFMLGERLVAEAEQTRVWARAREDDPESIRPVPVPEAARAALSQDRIVVQRLSVGEADA